ncbi:MAG: AsmA family protein [Proteobacteria bacterium]|nr:AsmA family protein [Pseudomonadota bacterium]
MKVFKFLLKSIFWLLLIAVCLVVIVSVGIFLYFNPNDYKQEITAFISQKSGLPLEIKGTIEMNYFPWLGFNVHQVSLPQAPAFGEGQFIHIEALSFKMPVRELFRRQWVIDTMTINGLNINLVKNTNGETNWDYFTNTFKQKPMKSTHQENKQPTATAAPKKQKKLSFQLNALKINQANLIFENKSQFETLEVSDINITSQGTSTLGVFPIKGQFKLAQQNSQLQQITLSGQAEFSARLNLTDKTASIDTTASLSLPHNLVPSITLNTHADIDSNKNVSLNNIQLQIQDQLITGNALIPSAANQPITLKLNAKQLNLDNFKKNDSPRVLHSAQNTLPEKSTKPISSSTQAQAKSLRGLKADINIDKLITKNLTLTHVKTNMKLENNQLKFSPLTADLYQGKLSLSMTKDLGRKSPIYLQGEAVHVQIQPLLKDFKQEKRLSGSANINFNLMHDDDIQGVTQINIDNGVLDGIDMRYYLSLAQNLFKKDNSTIPDTKQTSFGNLSATLKLHDKMIDNNDLIIKAKDFNAKGEGSIYLGSQTIEYKMQAWRQHKDNQTHSNAYPLAIRIKGSLQHPKVEPDMDLYLKKGLEQELKKQLNKQIEKNLGKILSNGSNETNGQTQDELQQKIEEKLNKKLKKLFKKKEE